MADKNKPVDAELMSKIMVDLYKPQSLLKTLKDHNVSAERFFYTLRTVPFFAQEYHRAQDSRADIFADQIIEIADTETDPQKARNRIEARKWATSKMKPLVYGDRIDLNVNQTIDIQGALTEAKNRIRDVLQIPNLQLAETTDTKTSLPLDDNSNVKPESESEALKRMLDIED